jgi:pilus assembly protein CpaC
VLNGDRISMRVRPEVSQLSSAGSVTVSGFTIPGITTRRAETTVELGSGQSFMIGGLLQNSHNNSVDKAPFLGDLPILGALFRSNSFKRSETELVIVVTPYLVKPVSEAQIKLPTDGYKAATDAQRWIGGATFDGKTGAQRPRATTGTPATAPGVAIGPGAAIAPAPKPAKNKKSVAAADAGFSFN